MKYPKVKKKCKFKRTCYNCKYCFKCTDSYRKDAINCKKFKFCATCKSI